MKESIKYFEQAIEKDSTYALAYAGLADSYIMLGDYKYISPKVAFPKGKAAATKALEIDDLLAEAHSSLAFAKCAFDWDWISAERGFKRAIELNPSYATARQWYAEYLTAMGRFDEAIKEIKRAQELDPLSLIINAIGARVFYSAREYDRAIEQCLKTLEMDPDFFIARADLGVIYLQKEMYEEALIEFQKAKNQIEIGITFAMMSKMAEARQVLDNLLESSKQAYIPHFVVNLAQLYFALGENDLGFKWFEDAYEERDSALTRLKVDPLYDGVRSDPRFKALLKRMSLE